MDLRDASGRRASIAPALLSLALFSAVSAAGAQTITEFALAAGVNPFAIVSGPDGRLWFTEAGSDLLAGPRLGVITTAGAASELGSSVRGLRLANGPDGAVWVSSGDQNAIVRVSPDGSQTLFPVPTPGAGLAGIAAGSDGNLWFIEFPGGGASKIGRITPAGVISEFPLPVGVRPGFVIAPGPDGALWFAGSNGLYRVAVTGEMARVLPLVIPAGFAWGPDRRIWYNDSSSSISAVDVATGAISVYPIPTAGGAPASFTIGPDGNLWFVEPPPSNKLGRITPQGAVTEFPMPAGADLSFGGLAAGPDGNLWFTEPRAGKVGRMAVATLPCVVNATTLCLNGGRFRVRVLYESAVGSGSGNGVPLTTDTGYFWFFSSNNVEIVVKVLNGCGFNQNYWVFAGGLTDVGVAVAVTDTATGVSKTYGNARGAPFAPLQATADFAVCPASPAGSFGSNLSGWSEPPGPPVAAVPAGREKRNAPGDSPAVPCVPGPTALCLNGNFQVRASYDSDSGSGEGQAVALTSDTGYFWFFSPGNVEIVVKVVNGCVVNRSYWVFGAGLTDVGVTLTVTDTTGGLTRTYTSPRHTPFSPLQRTGDLPICP